MNEYKKIVRKPLKNYIETT